MATLKNYIKKDFIGKGSFGEVYRATDIENKCDVALKTLVKVSSLIQKVKNKNILQNKLKKTKIFFRMEDPRKN